MIQTILLNISNDETLKAIIMVASVLLAPPILIGIFSAAFKSKPKEETKATSGVIGDGFATVICVIIVILVVFLGVYRCKRELEYYNRYNYDYDYGPRHTYIDKPSQRNVNTFISPS